MVLRSGPPPRVRVSPLWSIPVKVALIALASATTAFAGTFGAYAPRLAEDCALRPIRQAKYHRALSQSGLYSENGRMRNINEIQTRPSVCRLMGD